MPSRGYIDPQDEIVVIECKCGFIVRIHRHLLLKNSTLLASQLLDCKRQVASGIHVLRIDLPRRSLKRYALWLYSSSDPATFDPSLNATQSFLELSDLHTTARALRDEVFANGVIDLTIDHLVQRCNEMRVEDFMIEFLQSNEKGSMGRKLIADWMVSSKVCSDVKPKELLHQISDADFCYVVAKAVLRKTGREREGETLPPYLVS